MKWTARGRVRTKLALLFPEKPPRPVPRATEDVLSIGAKHDPRDRERMPRERRQDLLPRRRLVQPNDGVFRAGGFARCRDHVAEW